MTTPESSLTESRTAYVGALRAGLLNAAAAAREIAIVAADAEVWPLDEPEVLEALSGFARQPGRRLWLVIGDFERFAASHRRFAAWRRQFGHAVVCRAPAADVRLELPGWLLADDGTVVELIDARHWSARHGSDRARHRLLREELDALMQQCEDAWPVTTLGL